MSDEITMAAVIQSLSESAEVEKCWNQGYKTFDEIIAHADPKECDIQILRDYVNNNPQAGNYVVQDCQSFGGDSEKYGRSILVSDGKLGSGSDNVWVAFNGTQGHEWVDDAQGLYQESTIAQRAASARFDQYVQDYNLKSNDNIVVTGHSKGGNKAMFVTMNAHYANMIDSCVALDGQGFSPEAINHWNELYGENEFKNRSNKITLVSGRKDFVHELGISIVNPDKMYTVDYKGNAADFPAWHEHQYLFQKDKDGHFVSKLNSECKPDIIEGSLNAFMSEYMRLGSEERQRSAESLMAFIQLLSTMGDGTTSTIDGRVVFPTISKVLESLCMTSCGDLLVLFLCQLFPMLAARILAYVAFLKLMGNIHNKPIVQNNVEQTKIIILNEESFNDMNYRFKSAFDSALEGSEYAEKAESLQHDSCICGSLMKTVSNKSNDIYSIMDMIISTFKATEEDLIKKTERIGEDYLETPVANGIFAGMSVAVFSDGFTACCPPAPDAATLEKCTVNDIQNYMNEYVRCFSEAREARI